MVDLQNKITYAKISSTTNDDAKTELINVQSQTWAQMNFKRLENI